MKEPLKILILGDSHSTDYGAKSYVGFLPDCWDIFKITIPGKPIHKIREFLSDLDFEDFDVVIVQLGNPDMHPRIKKSHIDKIKSIFGVEVRQQWFSLPPDLSFKFFLKLPFILIKRIYVFFFKESYSELENVVQEICAIEKRRLGSYLLVITPFFVNKIIYGSFHNGNVIVFRKLLSEFIKPESLLNYDDDKIKLGIDGFHFTTNSHRYLASEIVKKIYSI